MKIRLKIFLIIVIFAFLLIGMNYMLLLGFSSNNLMITGNVINVKNNSSEDNPIGNLIIFFSLASVMIFMSTIIISRIITKPIKILKDETKK